MTRPKSTINAVTFETLFSDQIERIERCKLEAGDNAILDWINDLNFEL